MCISVGHRTIKISTEFVHTGASWGHSRSICPPREQVDLLLGVILFTMDEAVALEIYAKASNISMLRGLSIRSDALPQPT